MIRKRFQSFKLNQGIRDCICHLNSYRFSFKKSSLSTRKYSAFSFIIKFINTFSNVKHTMTKISTKFNYFLFVLATFSMYFVQKNWSILALIYLFKFPTKQLCSMNEKAGKNQTLK